MKTERMIYALFAMVEAKMDVNSHNNLSYKSYEKKLNDLETAKQEFDKAFMEAVVNIKETSKNQ